MLKLYFLLLLYIFIFTVNGFAQACGFGHGRFEVIGTKAEPIKNFIVNFYSTEGFDLSDKKKVIRVENEGNGWDIYPTEKDAEKFIAGKSPFNVYSSMFRTEDKEKADSIIFYKDNFYNYRTIELYGTPFLVKISAKDYENFYFISPVFGGCYYQREVTMSRIGRTKK